MPNPIKSKILLVLITAVLFIFANPARAEAPKANQALMLKNIALQNPKHYAQIKMADYGWYKQQYVCLTSLWGKESAWNHKADNPNSSAYGIAQMLGEKKQRTITPNK